MHLGQDSGPADRVIGAAAVQRHHRCGWVEVGGSPEESCEGVCASSGLQGKLVRPGGHIKGGSEVARQGPGRQSPESVARGDPADAAPRLGEGGEARPRQSGEDVRGDVRRDQLVDRVAEQMQRFFVLQEDFVMFHRGTRKARCRPSLGGAQGVANLLRGQAHRGRGAWAKEVVRDWPAERRWTSLRVSQGLQRRQGAGGHGRACQGLPGPRQIARANLRTRAMPPARRIGGGGARRRRRGWWWRCLAAAGQKIRPAASLEGVSAAEERRPPVGAAMVASVQEETRRQEEKGPRAVFLGLGGPGLIKDPERDEEALEQGWLKEARRCADGGQRQSELSLEVDRVQPGPGKQRDGCGSRHWRGAGVVQLVGTGRAIRVGGCD